MHSNLEQETMVKIRHSAIWSLLYISLYGVLTIASCFLLSEQTLATIGIVGGIFVLINIFLLPFKRELLFVGGIISVLGVMYGGVWIGKQLDLEGVLSIGAAVTAMDIISFTKIGKRTVNAKAISNVRLTSKLSVYGKEQGDTLIPTCGIGDYLYYAIWIAGMHAVSDSIYAYVGASCLIFLGTAIQYALIVQLAKRPNYKGFPGTVFPFLCILAEYLLLGC